MSNKLRLGYEVFFNKHSGKVASNFTVPNERAKAIALHLVDGDILIFWASVKREYSKWLSAFLHLQIP